MDDKNNSALKERAALLAILAHGDAEIAQGNFKDAEEIFAELDDIDMPPARNHRPFP